MGSESIDIEHRGFPTFQEAHGYAAFHLPNQEVVIITSCKVKRSRADAKAGREIFVGEFTPGSPHLEKYILARGLEAYRAHPADPEAGIAHSVVGRITTSQNLCRDPRMVASQALGSAWLSLGDTNLREMKGRMEAENLQPEVKVNEDGKTLNRVTVKQKLTVDQAIYLARGEGSFALAPVTIPTDHPNCVPDEIWDEEAL
jgi:hypothetical protein